MQTKIQVFPKIFTKTKMLVFPQNASISPIFPKKHKYQKFIYNFTWKNIQQKHVEKKATHSNFRGTKGEIFEIPIKLQRRYLGTNQGDGCSPTHLKKYAIVKLDHFPR